MNTHGRRLWLQVIVVGWMALAASSMCLAASSSMTPWHTGTYDEEISAPDYCTKVVTTGSVRVTGGSAAPDQPSDLGEVQFNTGSVGGATAEFDGRATGWGCYFTVWGVYVGTGGTGGGGGGWTDRFTEQNNPRILLEILDCDGDDDTLLLMGDTGGFRGHDLSLDIGQ